MILIMNMNIIIMIITMSDSKHNIYDNDDNNNNKSHHNSDCEKKEICHCMMTTNHFIVFNFFMPKVAVGNVICFCVQNL